MDLLENLDHRINDALDWLKPGKPHCFMGVPVYYHGNNLYTVRTCLIAGDRSMQQVHFKVPAHMAFMLIKSEII